MANEFSEFFKKNPQIGSQSTNMMSIRAGSAAEESGLNNINSGVSGITYNPGQYMQANQAGMNPALMNPKTVESGNLPMADNSTNFMSGKTITPGLAKDMDANSLRNPETGDLLSDIDRRNQQEFDAANATPYGDIVSGVAGAAGAITGIASYFDNKKTSKLQRKALETNIQIAKQEQAHRSNFRSSVQNSFA